MTEQLNVKQAAERLGVHPNTIRNWTNAGILQRIRTMGGYARYLSTEVERVRLMMRDDGGAPVAMDGSRKRRNRFNDKPKPIPGMSWYEPRECQRADRVTP